MAIGGSYLVLKVGGDVVAETTSVFFKVKSKKLNRTSQDSGINARYEPGKVKLFAAGRFLLASDGANWDTLFELARYAEEFSVGYYLNGAELFTGYGVLKRLTAKGGNSKKLITGAYGLTVKTTLDDTMIITEDGFILTTEDDKAIITE
jgi:hypothetical protein